MDALMHWTLQNSFAASFLFLLLVPFLIPGKFRLAPQLRILCLLLFALRLFLPIAPESRWSMQNILPTLPELSAPSILQSPDTPKLQSSNSPKLPSSHHPILPSPHPPILPSLWLAGVLAILFTTMIRWVRTYRQVVEESVRISPDHDLIRMARAIGIPTRVKIVESGANQGVAVFGLFRVTHLILPRNFQTIYGSESAESILRHEFQHIKSHDLLWNWVVWLIQTWHWFNPLVWIAGHLYRNEREILCDKAALKNCGEQVRWNYGKTLIKALEASRARRGIREGFSIGFISQKWEMKNRLELVMKNKPYRKLIQLGAIIGVALVSLVGFTSPSTFAEEKDANPAKEPGEKKPGPKDGDVKKEGPKDGDVKKMGEKDGDVKKEGPKDGDKPNPAANLNNPKERKVFAGYDKDGDGTVSDTEMEAMMERKQNSRGRREIRKAIDRADKDNDGKLNFEEFLFWYTVGRLDEKAEQ